MIRISKLAASVQPSATLAAGAKARQLRAVGVKVFDFSLGEPDFNTPKHICDAADKAAETGQTHYTPTAGTAEVPRRWWSTIRATTSSAAGATSSTSRPDRATKGSSATRAGW